MSNATRRSPKWKRWAGTTGTAMALALVTATPGTAQDDADAAAHGVAPAVTFHQVASLSEAAERYRSAALRQVEADAARSYLRAGRLAYQAGKLDLALSDLRRAAGAADAAGDATTAASARIDAAWVSLELRRVDEASDEVARARSLLAHAEISGGERTRLKNRLAALPF